MPGDDPLRPPSGICDEKICGATGDDCIEDQGRGMIVTQPAVTEAGGTPVVVVPTFNFDQTHPAGLVALKIVLKEGTPRFEPFTLPPGRTAARCEFKSLVMGAALYAGARHEMTHTKFELVGLNVLGEVLGRPRARPPSCPLRRVAWRRRIVAHRWSEAEPWVTSPATQKALKGRRKIGPGQKGSIRGRKALREWYCG